MPRFVSESAQNPLHLIISEQLREQILAGTYAPGEQLPSEHQLTEQFKVSRITVRRAIANLAHQGLVVAYRGKGVFVKEQRKVTYRLSNPLVFFEEDMHRQGVTSSIQNLAFEAIQPPEGVRQALQLPTHQTQVYVQKKLLLIDSSPTVVDISYILPDLGEKLAEELQQHMTFPTLEQHNITLDRIEATLECTHAHQELSELLAIPLGTPLLVYRYTAYTDDDRPLLYGYSASRGDRLVYSIILKRNSADRRT